MVAIAKQSQRANRHLHALEPLQAADENEQAAWAVADLAARLFAVDGLKHRQVDARWHDEHPVRVRAVRVHELGALVGGRCDQQVRLLRDLTLDANAQLGLWASTRCERLVLDESEGVRDVRPAAGKLGAEE